MLKPIEWKDELNYRAAANGEAQLGWRVFPPLYLVLLALWITSTLETVTWRTI